MITIIIPTYNNVVSLLSLINTIMLEKSENYEIIIIDDASTDNTQEACQQINNKQVLYYRNPHNIGTTQSRFKGLQYAKGAYIKFFDDDDEWISDAMGQQLQFLKTHNYNFVFSNYGVNNSVDNIQYVRNLADYGSNFTQQIIKQPGPFFQACLFKVDFIKKQASYFDSKAEPSEDWDFFISLSYNKIKAAYYNVTIFQWNYTSHSQSSNYKNETLALAYIINKHKEHILQRGSKKIFSKHLRILGSRFYFIKEYQTSCYYYKRAFIEYPYAIKNMVHRILQFLPLGLKKYSYNYINKKII